MTVAIPELRPSSYRSGFHVVLSRVEEVLVDGRRPDDVGPAAPLIDYLEALSLSSAPEAVRAATTLRRLHAELLAWQDQLEVRDGRRPPRWVLRSA
jgi:hypothetical protein